MHFLCTSCFAIRGHNSDVHKKCAKSCLTARIPFHLTYGLQIDNSIYQLDRGMAKKGPKSRPCHNFEIPLRELIKKVLPSLIRLACTIVVMYTIKNGISRFLKKDTRALTKRVISSDEHYIAFTVCPDYG